MITALTLTSLLLIQPADPQPAELRELLPGIRVAEGVVEFEGEICINAHHPDTPDVYLEMLVTAPDSREHESLVMARIKPSNLHAALLAAGFESGAPLSRDEQGEAVNAHGDSLVVSVAVISDTEPESGAWTPIVDWVTHIDNGPKLSGSEKWDGLVFAGSRLTGRGYEADGTGTLISLTSFGDEVIAPRWTLSHLAEIDEPVWIANRDLLPEKGTRVIVRIQGVPESHEPERVDIDGDP